MDLTEQTEAAKEGSKIVEEQIEQLSDPSFWSQSNILRILRLILLALIIFAIGYIIIKIISSLVRKVLSRTKISSSAIYYVDSILKFILYFLLITVTANSIGLQTGSLIALVASLGLAIALALRGSLTDFASGIMILVTRNIQVGDKVFLEGVEDYLEVIEIKLFSTHLKSRKNMIMIVPNEDIMQKRVKSLSKYDYIYADIVVGVDYESDIGLVKDTIGKVLDNNPKVLDNPDYIIGIENLGDSSVDILISAPVLDKDYFDIKLELREEVFEALKDANINIPFPQRVITIEKADKSISQ